MKKTTLGIRLCGAFMACLLWATLANAHELPGRYEQMERNVLPDAGVLSSSWTGGSEQLVIIFQENHISRVGQLEVALMLTRLNDRYGMNMIALEGAFNQLDTQWFYALPNRYVREEIVPVRRPHLP